MDSDSQRKGFQDFYQKLSPEERRRRVFLAPAYRSAYNELLDSEDRMSVPRYFWRKWLPILGPTPATLYMVMRDMSHTDARSGEDWCWPEQAELARLIGVKDHKTVRKHLRLLEKHGFIAQEATYYKRKDWGKLRGTNRYIVYRDLPLTAEDAVELLLREAEKAACAQEYHDGKISRYGADAVDNPPMTGDSPERHDGKNSRAIARENLPSNVSLLTSNVVNNVIRKGYKKSTLRLHPTFQQLSEREKEEREALAFEVGETLHRMAGRGTLDPHKSAGFHRRVAFLLPENLVRDALSATRDAVERGRSGEGGCHKDPGAYFAGVVKNLAAEAGIDLELGRSSSSGSAPRDRKPAQEARKAPPTGPRPEEPQMSPEEVREALRALKERLGMDPAPQK